MSDGKTLTFYLEPEMRRRAESGKINFVNLIVSAFKSCGYQSLFKGNSAVEILQSTKDPGYSLFFMEEPFHPRALTMRLVYFYPFWRIESSAKRWEWEVARTKFRPGKIDRQEADQFFRSWRRRLYGEAGGPRTGEYVYVPLQGRLLQNRSFQAASPIDMLRTTLTLEPELPVLTTLHPKIKYMTAEIDALNGLVEEYPSLVISTKDSKELLPEATYIVTENSGAALAGYFHEKPVILFGRIDFHHIAANVHRLGAEKAFKKVRELQPNYAKYLFWFLQIMSINAGRDGAEEKILAAVRSRGWTV